jgi:hypothetical protein
LNRVLLFARVTFSSQVLLTCFCLHPPRALRLRRVRRRCVCALCAGETENSSLCISVAQHDLSGVVQGYNAGFAHVPPLQMKGSTAAWEILVCAAIGLLISGIGDGLSNFFAVATCIAVAVSWLTFSNVVAALLFLMIHLFLLMVPVPLSF